MGGSTEHVEESSRYPMRRRLLIVAATALVLVTGIAAGLIFRAANPPAWVAEDGYDFDICTLIEPNELEPILEIFHDIRDSRSRAADDARYLQPVAHYLRHLRLADARPDRPADTCRFGFPPIMSANDAIANPANAVVSLHVGPVVNDLDDVGDGDPVQQLSKVSEDARYYAPQGHQNGFFHNGLIVAHRDDAEIAVAAGTFTGLANLGGSEALALREELTVLAYTVLQRLPRTFVMPGDVADHPCAAIESDLVTNVLGQPPIYSRSYVSPASGEYFQTMFPQRGDRSSVIDDARIVYCTYADHRNQLVEVRIHTRTHGLDNYIARLPSESDADIVNGVELYGKRTRIITDPNSTQVAFVTIGPGTPGDDYSTDELEQIAELGQAVIGATSK